MKILNSIANNSWFTIDWVLTVITMENTQKTHSNRSNFSRKVKATVREYNWFIRFDTYRGSGLVTRLRTKYSIWFFEGPFVPHFYTFIHFHPLLWPFSYMYRAHIHLDLAYMLSHTRRTTIGTMNFKKFQLISDT